MEFFWFLKTGMNGLLEFSGKLNFKKKCFTICRSLFHSIPGILGGRGNQGFGAWFVFVFVSFLVGK